jgi:hypothetical protein
VVAVFGAQGSDILRLDVCLMVLGMPKPLALCASMATNTAEE